jgi:hypothetical protein
MTRREEERERFADLCYEAWHRGRQEPDGDDFDRELASGKYPDEIRLADIIED